MFRKPKRPAQHRQRLTNEEGSTSDDEEGIPAKRLEDIRELQKCRERRHGFTAVECAVGKEAAADFEVGGNDPFHQAGGGMLELSEGRRAQRQAAGIEADIREQFKKETLLRDMDEELRKFIESGLKGDGGLREIATKEEEPSVANMDVNQIALHRAAAKVKDYKSGAATELLSNQMLAGIPEVDLGIGSRIVNILETEKKKSELLDISKQKKVVNEKQLLEVGRRQPTQFFTQKQIDALRECFNVYSDEGRVRNASQLRYMMRCLSYPVTQQQSVVYFEARKKNFDFAAFLETVHEESAGNPTTEVIRALRGLDREGNRAIPATELRALLMGVGERMSRAEVDAIMKEIAVGTIVPHQKLIQLFASNPNSQ